MPNMPGQAQARMQQKRASALEWTTANPVLSDGEIGIESLTNKLKLGNGKLKWSELPYFGRDPIGLQSRVEVRQSDPANPVEGQMWLLVDP